jgi:hypothetical protein
MSTLAAIIALVLFVLAAFGVRWEAVEILPLGLAFLALSFVLAGGIPTFIKTVRKE